MSKYIFSVLILCLAYMAKAQVLQGIQQGYQQGGSGQPGSGSTEPVTMKEVRALRKLEPKDWSIKYLKFSYDLIPTGRLLLKPDQKGQELQASISFYKYFFVLDGGFQDFTRSNTDYDYASSGRFFRFGPEVNLMKANEQGGSLTFGLRYAQSNFSDQLSFVEDVGFGETTYEFENTDARLIWMELTTGLNFPIKGNLQMGYTIRLKVFRNVDGIDTLRPFDVAGFGRYEKRTSIGFNYYLGWAIPFKKMEEAPVSQQIE